MKKSLLTLSLAALLAGPSFAQAPQVDDARINVVLKQYQAQFATTGKSMPEAEQATLRNDLRKNLQRNDLLKAEAIKKGLDKEADTKALFANMESEFYAGILIKNYQDTLKVTETMKQETYQLLRTEFHIEQAVFADVESANKALDTLKKGKNFTELAKEHPAVEGETVWLNIQSLPPQLTEHVLAMTKGEISSQPVLINGQYILFKVAGTRASAEFPPYEQLAPQLENITRQLKTQRYVSSLFKNAGI